jgi:hypothetical protein
MIEVLKVFSFITRDPWIKKAWAHGMNPKKPKIAKTPALTERYWGSDNLFKNDKSAVNKLSIKITLK